MNRSTCTSGFVIHVEARSPPEWANYNKTHQKIQLFNQLFLDILLGVDNINPKPEVTRVKGIHCLGGKALNRTDFIVWK